MYDVIVNELKLFIQSSRDELEGSIEIIVFWGCRNFNLMFPLKIAAADAFSVDNVPVLKDNFSILQLTIGIYVISFRSQDKKIIFKNHPFEKTNRLKISRKASLKCEWIRNDSSVHERPFLCDSNLYSVFSFVKPELKCLTIVWKQLRSKQSAF